MGTLGRSQRQNAARLLMVVSACLAVLYASALIPADAVWPPAAWTALALAGMPPLLFNRRDVGWQLAATGTVFATAVLVGVIQGTMAGMWPQLSAWVWTPHLLSLTPPAVLVFWNGFQELNGR